MLRITGKVLAVFGPGAKRIDTATATVGIRGTACYIESGEGQMYFVAVLRQCRYPPTGGPHPIPEPEYRYHDKPLTIGTDTVS
ncbi:MAG: hypothetical protein IPH37_19120 [Burkholderiales bacterium]|nr:hypothetical protein [Burkholderiales bacterium]